MTVSTENLKAGPYLGDGSSRAFRVNFPFLGATHLKVTLISHDEERVLTLDDDYHVQGEDENNGRVVLSKPLSIGQKLLIMRELPFTQTTNYVQGDTFPAQSHERALDKLTMLAQQLKEGVDRSLKMPHEETEGFQFPASTLRQNKLLGFDAQSLPKAITVNQGLVLEDNFIRVKSNIGIVSTPEGISILYGDGLDCFDNAIVVQLGNGLSFDEQAKVQIEKHLIETIHNNANNLINLQGLVTNLAKRVYKLELEGGDGVAIYIGNGLHYDEQGDLNVKPHTGITVNADGVSVNIGEGLEVDESGNIKVSEAVREEIRRGSIGIFLFVDLPETKTHEAIFVIDRNEFYTWSESQFFTGYRSPKVGILEDEGTGYLRPWQTGAYGALFRKDDPNLIRLWAWAQENNMVLPAANWGVKTFKFADVDEEHFRVPDLSNAFKRYTGTNYDNNESREVGTYQGQQLVHHAHHYNQLNYTDQVGWWGQPKRIPTNYTYEQTSGTGGSETRPENVAFHPRIHL